MSENYPPVLIFQGEIDGVKNPVFRRSHWRETSGFVYYWSSPNGYGMSYNADVAIQCGKFKEPEPEPEKVYIVPVSTMENIFHNLRMQPPQTFMQTLRVGYGLEPQDNPATIPNEGRKEGRADQ